MSVTKVIGEEMSGADERPVSTCVACRYGTPHHEAHCFVTRFGGIVESILTDNPYTDYSFNAQNAAVEKDRATRYARSVALWLLSRLNTERLS